MRNSKIAIIGGGNLGSAIAEGLIKSKFIAPDHITVTRRNLGELKSLRDLGDSKK
jgi:pyrroline-5-carboxylate reductase